MLYFQAGSETADLSDKDLREGLVSAFEKAGLSSSSLHRILLVPPDHTRLHSRAGEVVRFSRDYFGDSVSDILPALGTHEAMSGADLDLMYPGVPRTLFRVHDWRGGIAEIGRLDAQTVSRLSEGRANFDWPVQLSDLAWKGAHDLIISIGQVVPHEVMGMANYTKNMLVGLGGPESINKTHYIGALCGLESLMGVADTPPRRLLNYAWKAFASHLPMLWVFTVVAPDEEGIPRTRGLFIGDEEAFLKAAQLSASVNIRHLGKAVEKAVVWLDPAEFKSTWLGNKAIYRLRRAMADGGELLILAPGLSRFGEDPLFDQIIRRYGYRGTQATLDAVAGNADLAANLAVAAHLIHGSSEGRFRVTYCPGGLSRQETEAAGFGYRSLDEALAEYSPQRMKEGWNLDASGNSFFYVSNPALGLWAV